MRRREARSLRRQWQGKCRRGDLREPKAVFTRTPLSLSFFEASVLDHLVRGGARNALILAEEDGVLDALSEQGALRAGAVLRNGFIDAFLASLRERRGPFQGQITIDVRAGSLFPSQHRQFM